MSNKISSSKEYWEDYLEERVRSNLERSILDGETAVARRLLAHGELLQPFYEAIHPSRHGGGVCFEIILRCVLQIGQFNSTRNVSTSPPIIDGSDGVRLSSSDLLCALLAAIENSKGEWLGAIPGEFEMPDAALASLINVLLELPADAMIGAEYIKTKRPATAQQ